MKASRFTRTSSGFHIALKENRRGRFSQLLCVLAFGWLFNIQVFPVTIAWWRLNEREAGSIAIGSGSVIDSVGGHNGTPLGAPAYVPVNFLMRDSSEARALHFNGSNSWVFVPDNLAFHLTKSLTLEAFIRYDGQSTNQFYGTQIIFRGDDRPGFDPFWLGVTPDGNPIFKITDAGGREAWIVAPSPLSINTSYHVAATLNGATGVMGLYLNGRLVSQATTDIRPFGALNGALNPGLGIGNVQSSTFNEFYHGIIGEVRISDAALTPVEFLLASVSAQIAPTPNGFQIYWASQTNCYYQVQWTAGLLGGVWADIGPLLHGNGSTNYFPGLSELLPAGFYRIRLSP